MNDARRKRLKEACALLEQAKEIVSDVLEEERAAYDAISERFPQSEQEAALSESSSALEELDDALAEAIETVEGFQK